MDKKFIRKILLAVIFISALIIAGCAGAQKKQPVERPAVNKNPFQESISFLYYSMGYLAELSNQLNFAEEYYSTSAKYSYEPGSIFMNLAYVQSLKGEPSKSKATVEEALIKDPYNPQVLIASAKFKLEEEDVKTAKLLLERAIEIDPMEADGYFYLGIIAFKEGDSQLAESLFNKNIALAPDKAAVSYYNIGILYGGRDEYDKAVEYLNKAIETDPDYLKAYDSLAKAHEIKGNTSAALAAYENYLELNPKDTDIMTLMAEVHYRANDTDKALKVYDGILKIHPENADALYSKGVIYSGQKQYKEAVKCFLKVESLREDSIINKYQLAIAYENLKDYGKALEKLDQITRLDPKYVNAYYHIGYIYGEQKKLPQAIEMFEKLLESNKDNEEFYLLLGASYADNKQYQQAVDTYLDGIKVFADSEKLNFNLGYVYDRMKDYNNALIIFERIMKINPKNPDSYNYIGYTYAERGEKLDKALDLVNKALELDKGNGFYLDTRGWVYYKMGRYQDAVKELEAAQASVIKLREKADPVIYEHMGDAYLKINDTAKALDSYNKALESGHEEPEEIKTKIENIKNK
ncbi:MAG: tetratricopeptide repeat protein [Candidatus Goldbacteria bacterium]|nr:tetratricopeptide repeat protein [Candidatus Goldiibacteriota bacterium]